MTTSTQVNDLREAIMATVRDYTREHGSITVTQLLTAVASLTTGLIIELDKHYERRAQAQGPVAPDKVTEFILAMYEASLSHRDEITCFRGLQFHPNQLITSNEPHA